MIESKKVTEHFVKLYEGRAVYVWGMNCEEITPHSIEIAAQLEDISSFILHRKARGRTWKARSRLLRSFLSGLAL